MSLWNAPKAKVQLRLSVQRLKTLQQKKEAQAKASRREIATLIERGKLETARIKVESLINEDIYVELLELLELYCELLLARFGLLDQNTREPDLGVKESVCSIVHAAPRTELKELHTLRDILMHKYGREFSVAVMENRESCVSDRVTRKLNLTTPSSDLVDAYLAEIAKAYGVKWKPPRKDTQENELEETSPASVVDPDNEESDVKHELVLKAPTSGPKFKDDLLRKNDISKPPQYTILNGRSSPAQQPVEDDFEALTKRFAALKKH